MTTPPAGGDHPSSVVASRPCRRQGCKRVARPESPWCAWDFDRIVLEAYRTPKWATA